MADLIVNGGKPLSGTITPSGNKNSVLPILCATLLTDEPVALLNVPDITDVEIWTGVPGKQTLFAAGGYAGEASTVQPWAHPGTTFSIRNKADGAEVASVVVEGPDCAG